MKKRLLKIIVLLIVFANLPLFSFAANARVNGTKNFSKSYTLTGVGATDIVNVALAQEGKTGGTLGYSSEEWCADFIVDCAILSGQTKAIPNKTANASVSGLRDSILSNGGKTISSYKDAKPGDVVIQKYTGVSHVQLVYKSGGYTIEGNTGNSNNSLSKVRKNTKLTYINNPYTIIRPAYVNKATPSAPKISSYSAESTSSIKLTWKAVSGAETYRIDRRKKGDDAYSTIKTGLTGTTFTDTGLAAGTGYYYRVYAVLGGNISEKQDGYLAYTQCKAASFSSYSAESTSSIKLTWKAVSGAETYRIDRRKKGDDAYSTIKTGLTGTTFTDTGLAAGTGYYYRVYAVLGGNISAKQDGYLAYTQCKAASFSSYSAESTSSIKLTWKAVSGAETYRIDRRKKGDDAYSTIKTGLTGTTFTDTGLAAGTGYYYRVYAVLGGNISEKQDGYLTYTLCGAPTISSITATGTKTITVKWGKVVNATSYRVDRRAASEEAYTTVAKDLTAISYTDSSLSPNTKYYYRVYAINEEGKASAKQDGKAGTTLGAIGNCTVTIPESSYEYTGYAIKPSPTVKHGNITLKSGTEYTVSYSNNIDAGTAQIKITGNGDWSGTKTITFTIVPPEREVLAISIQPTNQSGVVGEEAVFSIKATGTGLSYQWQYKKASASKWSNSTMKGYDTDTIVVPITTSRDGQQYRCVVKDDTGAAVTSEFAALAVTGDKLAIITQPTNQSGAVGEEAVFSVKATGTGLSYQWQYKKASASKWSNSTMKGYDTDTIVVPITTSRDGQQYRCVVVDSNGNDVVSYTVTVTMK